MTEPKSTPRNLNESFFVAGRDEDEEVPPGPGFTAGFDTNSGGHFGARSVGKSKSSDHFHNAAMVAGQ